MFNPKGKELVVVVGKMMKAAVVEKALRQSTEVTVAELVKALQSIGNQGAKVHMSSDPEGNAIHEFSVVSIESNERVCLWPGQEVRA